MQTGSGAEPRGGRRGGSTLALALLVCGCVFAAMAGPALSLHTRSQALHQTLAGLTATTKTVQVSAPGPTSPHRPGPGSAGPAEHDRASSPSHARDRPRPVGDSRCRSRRARGPA